MHARALRPPRVRLATRHATHSRLFLTLTPSRRRQPLPPPMAARLDASLSAWVDAQVAAGAAIDPADLASITHALASATTRIAAALARAGVDGALGAADDGGTAAATGRDAPKKLDVVANDIMKATMTAAGCVGLIATEEDDECVPVAGAVAADGGPPFVAVFDPLDGSSNIAACIPTGTIWGLYRASSSPPATPADALQPGSSLVAAGYALYSSATMLVLTTGPAGGRGVTGFTLDREAGTWVATHPSIRVPPRGQFYSLNDARFDDWAPALQRYIADVRAGKGQSKKQYAARYVCSLVADLHRTILYGGWAGNPRSHLRRVYEAAPLAAIMEAAGGAASDGEGRVLDVTPNALHARAPFFAGSAEDIAELVSYGDVRQVGAKKYDV